MSCAERLRRMINENDVAPIIATDVPDDLKLDMSDLRNLEFEMADRIGRNVSARSASVRSAARISVS